MPHRPHPLCYNATVNLNKINKLRKELVKKIDRQLDRLNADREIRKVEAQARKRKKD